VWTAGNATVVACPDLSTRDRLVMHGDPDAVARLLRDEVLGGLDRGYRPMGYEQLLTDVAERLPEIKVVGRFAWMDITERITRDTSKVRWLTDDELGEVAKLLQDNFPDSYAKPRGHGVRRWAAIRDERGLVAVAADAWSSSSVGLLADVATRADARGQGHASTVCAFVVNQLLSDHNRVALLADYWNVAAITAYTNLGFVMKGLAAAELT
jgi:GNAT superfamily N-acetyltransferase